MRTGKRFAEQILCPSPPRLPISGAPASLPTCRPCWKLPPAMPGLAVLGLAAVLGVRAGAPLCLSRQLSWPGDYVLGGAAPRAQLKMLSSPGLLWALATTTAMEEINSGSVLIPGAAPGLQPLRHVLGARGCRETQLGVHGQGRQLQRRPLLRLYAVSAPRAGRHRAPLLRGRPGHQLLPHAARAPPSPRPPSCPPREPLRQELPWTRRSATAPARTG